MSDCITSFDTDRCMLRSCRRTAKHFEHVWRTWVRIVRSASMKIPRSRTHLTGDTRSEPTANESEGSWHCRRAEAHHSTSVLDALSWSRLERIQSATAATQSTIHDPREDSADVSPSGFRWSSRRWWADGVHDNNNPQKLNLQQFGNITASLQQALCKLLLLA